MNKCVFLVGLNVIEGRDVKRVGSHRNVYEALSNTVAIYFIIVRVTSVPVKSII